MSLTSEFSVAIDEVLKKGISTDKWYIEAPKSSFSLAISVANKWWKVEKPFESLKTFTFPLPVSDNYVILEKVKEILRWNQALEAFTREESEIFTIESGEPSLSLRKF